MKYIRIEKRAHGFTLYIGKAAIIFRWPLSFGWDID